MALPLFRPLRYRDHPFVQDVRSWRARPGRVPLIDDFEALRSSTFDPDKVHPLIRRFYESSSRTSMTLEWLRWERWALPLAWGYVPLARKLNNLCVPDRIDSDVRVTSAVNQLSLGDGGSSRQWTRTFTGTGEMFYSAGFRHWVDRLGERTYLSMAFPYGRAQLMVLLRLENRGDGFVASTRKGALAGTYGILAGTCRFVAVPGPPTDEVLSFEVDRDRILGLHEDFIGSRRTFAMRYRF